MKTVIKNFILFIVLTSIVWMIPQKSSAQVSVSVNFQVFYDDLSPYGNWVDNSDYGYVWVPNVSRGFTPYGTNGYWVFTDEGWTWVSNYSWGWAPFHYGRWFYDSYYGWLWVPDTEWGPAWVMWRRSDDYYGWAPLGPGISIDFAYNNGYSLPYDRWRFVRCGDFGRTDINNYYISTTNNTTIINNTTVINNFREDRTRNGRYSMGPDRTEVEKRAGKTFTPIAIKESSSHGQRLNNNQLEIYRPQMQKNISAERKPVPSKVMGWKRDQPATEQPMRKQTTTEQPARQQPTKEQPMRKHTTTEQPVRQQPTREQPEKQKSTKEQPTRQQPTRDQPTKDQPKKQQPTRDQPPGQQPTREQPTKQQPTQHQPTREQPAKDQPSKPQQTKPPKKGKG